MSTQAEEIRQTLIFLWTNRFKDKFLQGKLVYERQFQAELYRLLYDILSPEYEIWVENHIKREDFDGSLSQDSKILKKKEIVPDLVICRDKQISTIIEIKWKPWEEPGFQDDIDKLIYFIDYSQHPNKSIRLGALIDKPGKFPTDEGNSYPFAEDFFVCYIFFSHPEKSRWAREHKIEPLIKE